MNKYKSYTELNKESVEWWAKALDEEKKEYLPKETVELFLAASLSEQAFEEDKDGSFSKLLGKWNSVSIIQKRLQYHTFTMGKAAILIAGMLVSTPGEVVIMLNYFQYRCHLRGIKHIDMKNLSIYMIPDGWFSKDTLYQYWEKQKFVSKDNSLANMLDYPLYAKSIRTL